MSGLSQDFWKSVPIPSPALAALRDLELERSEQRPPKWKFRLASDLVLQIQPKLTTALLKFECCGICEGADLAVLLAKRSDIKRPYSIVGFELRADSPDVWFFKARSVGGSKSADPPLLLLLRQDLIDAFQAGRFEVLRPELMLGSPCLVPECAGTSSEQLPFVLRLTEQAASAGAP